MQAASSHTSTHTLTSVGDLGDWREVHNSEKLGLSAFYCSKICRMSADAAGLQLRGLVKFIASCNMT